MKNKQWLWNLLSIVLLAVGLVVWIMLPWQGVLAVAVLVLGLWPAPLLEVMQVTVRNLVEHIVVSKVPL